MCFEPITSPIAVGTKRYLHRVGLLHLFDDNLLYLFPFVGVDTEVQFIVYLQYHL